MQETTNYKLKKLELTDSPADITVLNENWDKLDTEVKEHDSSLISHAQSITEINEELEGINTELDSKYDKAGGTISGAVSIASGGLDVTGDSTFNDNVTVKGITVHEGIIRSTKANFLETKVDVSRGTPPGSTLYSYWSVFSKDGYAEVQKQSRLAHIDYSISNTGISSLGLYVNKYVADNREIPVGLFARWTGEIPQVMLTHTPPANSNDKSIATTDWVRALRATASEYGLIKLADESDLLSEADEAALTVSGAYKLADFRRMSTAYALGDTVNCAFKSEYFLECTQAGTTSAESLDTRNVTFGQVITDGTCQWTVRSHLKSINGSLPDENGNINVNIDTDNLAKLDAINVFEQRQEINGDLTLFKSHAKGDISAVNHRQLAIFDNSKNTGSTATKMAHISQRVATDGSSRLEFITYKNESGNSADFAQAYVEIDAKGNKRFIVPTPADNASGLEAINAQWIDANINDRLEDTTTAGSVGPTANASPAHGDTFTVPQITVDAKGRVTAKNNRTITLPSSGAPSIATQSEAQAGTNNTKMMTPLRVKQAISANGGWGAPDYDSAITFTLSTSSSYTAPSNGYIVGTFYASISVTNTNYILIDGFEVIRSTIRPSGAAPNEARTLCGPIAKGSKVTGAKSKNSVVYFVPCN